MKPIPDPTPVQGEGDYASDRRYRASAQSFVASGKAAAAAAAAAGARPPSKREQEELRRAEITGQSHSKGEDPGVRPVPAPKP